MISLSLLFWLTCHFYFDHIGIICGIGNGVKEKERLSNKQNDDGKMRFIFLSSTTICHLPPSVIYHLTIIKNRFVSSWYLRTKRDLWFYNDKLVNFFFNNFFIFISHYSWDRFGWWDDGRLWDIRWDGRLWYFIFFI